jgi:urease accessory protein
LIRDDAVIVNMLLGLGATVKPVLAAFTPEAGAYDSTGSAAIQHDSSTVTQHNPALAHQHPHDFRLHAHPHAHGDSAPHQHEHALPQTHASAQPGHSHDD